MNQATKLLGATALLIATTAGWSASLVHTNGLNGWLIAIGASVYGLARALEVGRP